jgi:DNA-binding LacI/PurR family transcriptional regulator
MAVTMKDVAKLAGLSLGTVSNYINRKSTVTEINRKKIEEAIVQLDYRINYTARSLKTNSFDTVGVLIPELGNTFITKIVSQIENLLKEHGFNVIVVSYHSDFQKEKELFEYFSNRVDGIIFVPSAFYNYDETEINAIIKRVPIIQFIERLETLECDAVIVENEDISIKAVTGLLNKGKRNIGIIVGPEGFFTTKQRVLGYQEAHEKLSIPLHPELIAYSDYSKETAIQITERMLKEHPEVDGFFVCGYRMTLGVLTVLQKNDLTSKIPVVGYDTEEIAPLIQYPFSYVTQPHQETAKLVAELMVKRIKGDKEGFPSLTQLNANIETVGGW